MASYNDYRDAISERARFLQDQSEQLRQAREEYKADIQRLEQLLERNRREMVGYLLADVGQQDLEALERRLSYPGLQAIRLGFEQRREALAGELERLEQTDELTNHDYHLARIEQEIEQIQEVHDHLRQRVGLFEKSPWLGRLVARGYFGPDYRPPLFDRFRDWRAVSFCLADLEQGGLDLADPDQLRRHYRTLRAEADPIFELYEGLVRQQSALRELKSRAAALRESLDGLPQQMYQELGRAITDHLEACTPEMRQELAGDDAHLVAFLKKTRGLNKQIQYLRELIVTRLDSTMASLEQQQDKLTRKSHKLRRKGAAAGPFTEEQVSKLRELKADKWRRRQQGYRELRGRIAGFDRYDDGSLVGTFLWWDLMTNRARGDDIYEVRTFREQHPQWDHRQDRSQQAMDGAAAALAVTMAAPDDDLLTEAS